MGNDLTKSSTATRVMLVQIVLQCVPAPSNTHHHMSPKDLREDQRKTQAQPLRKQPASKQIG